MWNIYFYEQPIDNFLSYVHLYFQFQVCGAVFIGVGIALAVDEDAWDWFENISGGMSDGLYSTAVYIMISKYTHKPALPSCGVSHGR